MNTSSLISITSLPQRLEILNTNKDDFVAFAERLKALNDKAVAVVTSKGMAEEAIKAGKEMDIVEIL